MMSALRAELKKLFSIRSTYAILLVALILLGIISFYGRGYKVASGDLNNHFLVVGVEPIATAISFFVAFIALLLMAHEYRYNTIVYTLTAANSRTKVLAAKLVTVLVFTLGFTILATLISLGLTLAGVAAAGHSLPAQDINYLVFFAKIVYFTEGYALTALLIATLVRNMQAAVAVLFIVPNTVEALLSTLIKQPDKWLPFSALAKVIQNPVIKVPANIPANLHPASPARGAVTFGTYLVIGWLITWYFFLRRDAQ